MPGKEEAEQFKAAGNAALQSNNLTEAIENYTKAINADGTNHVYYSNRSAAYLKKGDGNNALEDANSTIAINPEFSKGYSRKGGELLYIAEPGCFAGAHISCSIYVLPSLYLMCITFLYGFVHISCILLYDYHCYSIILFAQPHFMH